MSAASELTDTIYRNASRPFLIEAASGRELTHGGAYERALALAGALREEGIRRGERVAVGLPNSAELAIVYEAALLAGLVIVPVGSGFGRRQLRELLTRARPRIVLTGNEGSALRTVADELGMPIRSIAPAGVGVELPVGLSGQLPAGVGGESSADVGGQLLPGVGSELDIWSLPRASEDTPRLVDIGAEDIVSVHFTSGSTGTPRGVAHRLRDFLDNAIRYTQATGLDSSHRFHHSLPMTYMAGYYNLFLLPLRIGASIVVDRAFDAQSALRYWEVPRRHGVDVLWLVPTIMAMLLKVDRGEQGRAYCRERVRHAACATAPLDPTIRERFEQAYGVAVHDSYGLSETLLVTASTPRHPSRRGSVGRALHGIELRVKAQEGSSGPIVVRSPDTTAGYLEGCDREGGLELHAPADRDGWLETGDIGAIDPDGELRITGRQKDIIIRGGINISAVDLERVLAGANGVEHLAAVGVPHELLGEQVAVVFATSDGASFAEVESVLKSRSAADGAPRADVYVHIDEMPLTPTGKIRKGALRDMVIDLLDLPESAKGFSIDVPRAGTNGDTADGDITDGDTADRHTADGYTVDGDAADRHSSDGDIAARLRGVPVDITHPIRHGMLSFPSPNHPSPEVTVLARHEIEGRMTRRLVLGTHTGTHLDAPLHFVPGGEAVDALALTRLVGPAGVANLSDVGALEEVSRAQLERALGGAPCHPRLLLRFDWSTRFGDPSFYSQSPYLSEEACRWLLDAGVNVLGMDTPSPDDPRHAQDSATDSPNHHLLLGAGVVLLEYLTNLDRLGTDVFLVALPLPVEGADGAPMRAIAFT